MPLGLSLVVTTCHSFVCNTIFWLSRSLKIFFVSDVLKMAVGIQTVNFVVLTLSLTKPTLRTASSYMLVFHQSQFLFLVVAGEVAETSFSVAVFKVEYFFQFTLSDLPHYNFLNFYRLIFCQYFSWIIMKLLPDWRFLQLMYKVLSCQFSYCYNFGLFQRCSSANSECFHAIWAYLGWGFGLFDWLVFLFSSLRICGLFLFSWVL